MTPRTIRYYVAQGLLASPGTPGPGPKYTDADLARLRLIKRLQREHQPLAEIRRQLEGLADEDVLAAEAAPEPAPRIPPSTTSSASPRRPVRSARRSCGPQRLNMPSIAPTAPAAPALEPPSEPRLERSQWERIELAPDVELHIRRPLARATAKRVDRIISIARDLLEEDPS